MILRTLLLFFHIPVRRPLIPAVTLQLIQVGTRTVKEPFRLVYIRFRCFRTVRQNRLELASLLLYGMLYNFQTILNRLHVRIKTPA